MSRENPHRRAWLGIVLLVLGAFFLLRNLHLLPIIYFPYWFFDWEMLFILIGTALALTGRRGGIVFILIGVFFLLPDIFHIPRFHVRDWWPLILLIIGVSILLRTRGGDRGGSERNSGGSRMTNDSIDDVNIFGGGNKNITSKNFQGGKVTSIFGGAELNFGDTVLSPDNATLDVFTLFGGTTLFVPADWTIRLDGLISVFGGFSDKRRNIKADPAKVLSIKGLVLFGGGEVKTA